MSTVSDLRLEEYRLEQQLSVLQRGLFEAPGEEQVKTLLSEIDPVLQALAAVRARIRAETKDDAPALLKVVEPRGSTMGEGTTGTGVTVILRITHVPTSVVHLLDPAKTPLVSVKLRYVGTKFARLRVSACVEGMSAEAAETIELTQKMKERTIDLLPIFFPARLREVTELSRASLRVRVEDLDRNCVEQDATYPIWLLARTTARLSLCDPSTKQDVDLLPYLGAFVTPNAPEVLELLRKAADLHPDRHLVGYQEKDEASVTAQVRAIYEALKAQQITYVNTVLFNGGRHGEWSQRIRLPRESIAMRSANCIDGVVLMASLLEAASLAPALVILPGHAILGWRRVKAEDSWAYLDTTLVASDDFDAACRQGESLFDRSSRLAAINVTAEKKPRQLAIDELRASAMTPME